MSNPSTLDRESFQNLLASAFVVQQSRMDTESLSAIVEAERLITRGKLNQVDGAIHLIVDGTRKVANTSGVASSPSGVQVPAADSPKEISTLPAGDQPSTPADTADAYLASFQVRPPKEKTARFRFRDPWTPSLLILVSALALLLGWMLGRVTWPGTAQTKAVPVVDSFSQEVYSQEAEKLPPPPITARADATPAQPKENRQADQSPPLPLPQKERSPEAPSGSLIVYQEGKVIFRLEEPENVVPSSPEIREIFSDQFQRAGEPSTSDTELGSTGKAKIQLIQLVQPEYPEAARQQHIQGPVVLESKIGKDGTVQQLTVISGNPMLANAASNAVRQWRFKPRVRNGRAVQFQTQIKLDFALP
jgi:TonB family protein